MLKGGNSTLALPLLLISFLILSPSPPPRPSNTDTQQQEPPVDIISPYPVDTIPPGGADQQ